jgi:hypothetical protein
MTPLCWQVPQGWVKRENAGSGESLWGTVPTLLTIGWWEAQFL